MSPSPLSSLSSPQRSPWAHALRSSSAALANPRYAWIPAALLVLAACDYDPTRLDASAGLAGSSGTAGASTGTGGAAGSETQGAAGSETQGAAGSTSVSYGGLAITSTPKRQQIDLFGLSGHRFWVEVDENQLARLNGGGNGMFGEMPFDDGDIYTPGNVATYADHVLVQDFATGSVADYGKLEIKLIGESTYRQWDISHIPNLRIDTDEFQQGARIGETEHLRLNNSLVGSIFREHIAHRIYRELGYPALRSSFAFLGSNVWGDDIWVPMTLIEVYKCRTFEGQEDTLGGGCVNMWEFAGDIGYRGDFGVEADFGPDACQNHECDNTRLNELSAVAGSTPAGDEFEDALEPYVDWDMFHRFQCLSWIMSTGDDAIHNSNNNLIIERDDGRMIWAPYSVDISAGQDWYTHTPLTGSSILASGCQANASCWADTIATCETLITQFQKLKPETFVDQTEALLEELGMLRDGDEARAASIRQWYVERQAELLTELESYRYLPDAFGNCPEDLERCNDSTCGTPEACETRRCFEGQQWCEAFGYCIDSRFDQCPSCTEEEPFWCAEAASCLGSEADCQDYCMQAYGNEHCCSEGSQWCEAFGYCLYDEFEQCPGCTEEAPVWCNAAWQCAASDEACHALCNDGFGNAYCEVYDACLPPDQCFQLGPVGPIGPIGPMPVDDGPVPLPN